MPEITSLLHPFSDARQALWLCEQLSQQRDAEIPHVIGLEPTRILKDLAFPWAVVVGSYAFVLIGYP